jgi:hypothetical protein
MAGPFYVRSTDGDNSSDGLSWTNAKATIANAVDTASAGETIYVSDNHAELTSGAAVIWDSPGTAVLPLKILCVDDAAEPPTALAKTATVGSNTLWSVYLRDGYAYVYGLIITAGTSTNPEMVIGDASDASGWILEDCDLRVGGTSTISKYDIGTASSDSASYTEFINTSFKFTNASQKINVTGRAIIRDCAAFLGAASTVPTTLFQSLSGTSTRWGDLACRNLGLQDQSGALVDASYNNPGTFTFADCKLHGSVVIGTGNAALGGTVVRAVNCGSGDTNYNYYLKRFPGSIVHETTIVRTDGASDGTTPFSRKVVTVDGATIFMPLRSDPVVMFSNTSGSQITVTVEVVTDNVTLTDAEAWLELSYLGTSGFPLGLFASDRAGGILATPANQTTSNATWTTTGLTTPVTQKLAVTVTPQEKGVLSAVVCLGKANTTLYFDPVLTVT